MTMAFYIGIKGHIFFLLIVLLFYDVSIHGGRLPVEEDYIRSDLGETGKYLYRTHQFRILYCYYCPRIAFMSDRTLKMYTEVKCNEKNSQLEADEKENHLYPYCRKGKKIACPSLPELEHGRWDCGDEDSVEVRVYKSCQPHCIVGYHLARNVSESYRCGETRQWDRNVTAARCIKNDPKITKGTTVSQNVVENVTNSSHNSTVNYRDFDMSTPYTQRDQPITQISSMNDDTHNFPADSPRVPKHDSNHLENKAIVEVNVTRNVSVKPTIDGKKRKHIDSPGKDHILVVIVGVSVPLVVLVIVIVVIVWWCCCSKHRKGRKKSTSATDNVGESITVRPLEQNVTPQRPDRNSQLSVSQTTESSSGYLSASSGTATTALTGPIKSDHDSKDRLELTKQLQNQDASRDSENTKEEVTPVKSARGTRRQHSVEDADSMDELDKLLSSDDAISGLTQLSMSHKARTVQKRPPVGPGQSLQQIKMAPSQDCRVKDSMDELDKLLPSDSAISGVTELSKEQRPGHSLQQMTDPSQGCTEKKSGSPTCDEDYIKIYPSPKQVINENTTEFTVVSGSNVYITTRCPVGKDDAFEISKVEGTYRGYSYGSSLSFIHCIGCVQESDTGKYFWEVKNSSENRNHGSFILAVISEKSQVSTTPVQITDTEYSSLCKTTVSEVINSCSQKDVMTLYYTLDGNKEWFYLAKALLPRVDPALFESLRWHKRGNPKDGPTEYIFVELFIPENTIFGKIVKYFAESKEENVKNLLKIPLFIAHYETCSHCDDIAKVRN